MKTKYPQMVATVIESSKDNTSGIVLSETAIKKVFRDMDNKINKPLEEYETQRGYLVKDSDFIYAIKKHWND